MPSSTNNPPAGVRSYVVKQAAHDFTASAQQQLQAFASVLPGANRSGLLPPPYDFDKLCHLAETSSILSACIDAMEVNVESFGLDFVPAMEATQFEQLQDSSEHEQEMQQEREEVAQFFQQLHPTLPYMQLRRLTRRDYELTGNAYWEIVRNPVTQAITGVQVLPARHMRIGALDSHMTPYVAKRRHHGIELQEVPSQRRFRRYAQLDEAGKPQLWLKEFGDPRLMDAQTGGCARVQRDEQGRIRSVVPEKEPQRPFSLSKYRQGNMQLATEVLHFCLSGSPRTLPYGVPRWIGALTPLLGLRLAEETNLTYFDHKTVPPGMLLVSGGSLSDKSVERIATHIRDHIKGHENFHSILVVEARQNATTGLSQSGAPVLQWVKMTDAQRDDALFQQYELGSTDKVIGCFRFWSGFVGRTKEINVATARVARELSEEQVFAPEREAFDAIINRMLLPELGVRYWLHKSKGPQLSTPRETAELLQYLQPYLSIEEGRDVAGRILGTPLEELKEAGLDRPLAIMQPAPSQQEATPQQQQHAGKQGALKEK